MCDYSLKGQKSRAARPGDKLRTHDFGGTRGLRDAKDTCRGYEATAVCLLPGTEIAFNKDVRVKSTHTFVLFINGALRAFGLAPGGARTATFLKINEHNPIMHHDAVQFPDGAVVLLNELLPNQKVTVVSLPAVAEIPTPGDFDDVPLDDKKIPVRELVDA